MIPEDQKTKTAAELSVLIQDTVKDFLRSSPANSMHNGTSERVADDPLIGFSSGGDPLYLWLQQDIGSPFMTPVEIFQTAFPRTNALANELSVISIVLPKTLLTLQDNSKETTHPSERWIRSKHFGEEFGYKLCTKITEVLAGAGYEAVIPVLTPAFVIGTSGKYGRASSWSERHAAYVSGLGTFGLCDGLITARGKAHQCFSVIARITLPPTPRPYTDHHAYCLFYAHGTCGKCISRCPSGALSKDGHDKKLCREYSYELMLPYAQERFGIDNYGCGLCQTGVPCESANPVRSPSK